MLPAPFSASLRRSRATIEVDGKPALIDEPSDAIALGLAFVPEDRARPASSARLPVEQNITAAMPAKIAPGGVIRLRLERALAQEVGRRSCAIRLASLRQPIGELSGGNQQKAILARWLLTDPSILILDEPTRGIDIGVKAEFYDMIGELAADGPGHPADLVRTARTAGAVRPGPRHGRRPLTADIPRGEATQETIMQAAVPAAPTGSRRMKVLRSLLLSREAGHRGDDRAVLPCRRHYSSRNS